MIRHIRHAWALPCLLLTACTPSNVQSVAQTQYDTCKLFDAGMEVVAPAIRAHKVSPNDYPIVNKAIAYARPICGVDPQPVLDAAGIAALAAQVAVITAESAALKSTK